MTQDLPAPRPVSPVLLIPFLAGIFLPYLKVSPLNTDVQPLALGVSLVIVLWYGPGSRIPRPILALSGLLTTSVAVLVLSDADLNSLRSMANYASFSIIPVATFLCVASPLLRGVRLVDAANVIWCSVGLVQTLYDREFLTFALSNSRTTVDRGVMSLAAEPSFYGTIAYIFLMIYVLQRRELSWWALLAVFQIVFFAQSPLGTAMLALFLIVYVFLNINIRTVLLSAVLITLSLYVLTSTSSLGGGRLGIVVQQIMDDPADVIRSDHSTSARFYHIVFSLKGAATNGFIPRGYSAWSAYFESEMGGNSLHYMRGLYEETPNRIMSALGAACFELGIFGLIVPTVLLFAIRHHYGTLRNRRALTLAVGMMLAMSNSVPLGFPLYGFMVGYCCATLSQERFSALSKAAMIRGLTRKVRGKLTGSPIGQGGWASQPVCR